MKKLYVFVSLFVSMAVAPLASAVTHIITQQSFTFSPNLLTVEVGDTLEWQWTSGTHTTTSLVIPVGAAAWDAPLTSGSPTFSYKVEVAGDYSYKCSPHFSMGMVGAFQATEPTVFVEAVANVQPFVSARMVNENDLQIELASGQSGQTVIQLMDVSGRSARLLLNSRLVAGYNLFHFDLSGLTAGIYVVCIRQNGQLFTTKIYR